MLWLTDEAKSTAVEALSNRGLPFFLPLLHFGVNKLLLAVDEPLQLVNIEELVVVEVHLLDLILVELHLSRLTNGGNVFVDILAQAVLLLWT